MTKKLTLTVEENVIKQIKEYAQTHNASVSKLVENYFRMLTIAERKEEPSETVNRLLGSIEVPENFNYDAAKREYLEERYL